MKPTRPNRRLTGILAGAATLALVGGLTLAHIGLGSGPADAAQPSQAANAAVKPDILKNKDPQVWKVEAGPFDADGQQAYTVMAQVERGDVGHCQVASADPYVHFVVQEPAHQAYTVKAIPDPNAGCVAQIKVASTVPGTTVVKAWQLNYIHEHLRGQADLEFEPTIG